MTKSYLSAAFAATVLSTTLLAAHAEAQTYPSGTRTTAPAGTRYTNPTRTGTMPTTRPAATTGNLGAPRTGISAPSASTGLGATGMTARKNPAERAKPTYELPAGRPTKIALLDLPYVLYNHQGFKSRMNIYVSQRQQAVQKLQADKDRLAKIQAARDALRPSDPNWDAYDKQLTEAQADLAVKMRTTEKDFLKMEAQIHADVYADIEKAVYEYSAKNGITLVWRHSNVKPDPSIPETVRAHISQPMIMASAGMDITQPILSMVNRTSMNQTASGSNAPARPGVYTNRR